MYLKYLPAIGMKFLTVISIASVLLLGGCGDKTPEEQPEPVRPVKTLLIEAMGAQSLREFPGIVRASQEAELAFQVSGKLKEFPVREGDDVEQGDVIAQLDETDFQIALNDASASHKKAKADYQRAKELLPQGHISRSDYDKLESQYNQALASLEQAKQNFDYTTLRAAFKGTVAKRFVENFEQINAKQKIALLQDHSSLDIVFDIPENLMILIDRHNRGNQPKRNIYAQFNAIPGEQFPLIFKEVATDADERTQTYRITVTMTPHERFNILPGMTTTVVADASHLKQFDQVVLLPVSSVSTNTDKQATVWLVDEQSMTVNPQQVEVGPMQGDRIKVTGLKPGNRVVTTGVAFLRKGMKVSLLETGEQPQ